MTSPPASELRRLGGLPVLSWPAFDEHALDAAVTTREGGVSTGRYHGLNLGLLVGDDETAVLANRARVADAFGGSLDDFVFCEQSHQPNVQVVTDQHRGRGARSMADAIAKTDALVTAVPGITLVVMAADCVPLVLFEPVARVLACVHAGWGGTVRGVTPAAVEAMRTLGADPQRIIAGIGPAIHPDRYQVGADVAELAEGAFGAAVGTVVRPDGTGKWLFDLWQANALQLAAAGVPSTQVHIAGRDTGPDTPFYSHRSEGPCGRFAAVARLHAAD
ncbi:MAG TPA: peptidoglycan editing factor PgeF [Kineosporiaceae bacterium]|nr:peptidoglycan editing factor PgeF [Kineosporiaceae bacterium]